jgi:hypothetical protein
MHMDMTVMEQMQALVVGGGLNLAWQSSAGPDMTRWQER